MWICLNNGFFSIVAQRGSDDRLVVRARRKGDLERVFGVEGIASPGRDYAFRAFMERDDVASVLMCNVLGIDYPNFKNSVKDNALHSAYNRVWSVMGDLQVGGPYGSRRSSPRQRPLPMGHNYGPREAAAHIGASAREEEPVDLWDAGDIGGAIDAADFGGPAGLAYPLDELPRVRGRKRPGA